LLIPSLPHAVPVQNHEPNTLHAKKWLAFCIYIPLLAQ
jgi:hypothetical protein